MKNAEKEKNWVKDFKKAPSFTLVVASMVTYLSSFATRTIQVLTAEVGTTLTISAPASVIQGQPFRVEGVLKRVDTGTPLEGENIVLSYNGTILTTAQTRYVEGAVKYQADVQIDEMGSFILRADFAGSTRAGLVLGPSGAFMRIGLGEPSILPLLVLAGIVAYAVMKK